MANKFQSFFYISIIIIFSVFFRFHNISNFYSETDDQIAMEQLIKYENLDIYDVANDKKSPSYNSPLKIKIRKIEKKNNVIIDQFQAYFSKFLFNMAPSKHSTFAPLQYALFGWMVSPDQTYKELKFFSRIPSAIFSILTILLIFLISKKIFGKINFLRLYPAMLSSISLPLIFISQRSYNYSAAGFAFLVLILIFLNQFFSNEENFINIKNKKCPISNNIIISIILALLAYCNFILLLIMPVFFIYLFIYNYFKLKKLFSYFSINLFIIGFIYLILVIPLLLHVYKFNLNEYGMTGSTCGEFCEYSLRTIDLKGVFVDNQVSLFGIFKFYLINTYLVITRYLSFFSDNFIYANVLQFLIFLLTVYGIVAIYMKNNSIKILKIFTSFIFSIYLYWCILSFFNIASLGPTRHLSFLAPIFAIYFSYGTYKIIQLFNTNYKKKIFTFTLTLVIISIFALNYKNFLDKYEDTFDEVRINKLIDQFNIGYIMNDGSFSNQLCYMNSLKVKIFTCPLSFNVTRHNYATELSFNEMKSLKDKGKSIAFLNFVSIDKVYQKKFSEKYIELLKDISQNLELADFKLNHEINIEKFSDKSPLIISKYKPNIFRLDIYK